MTRSLEIITKVNKEARFGSDAGSNLARITLELLAEYEQAIKDCLRLEKTIHDITKEQELYLG